MKIRNSEEFEAAIGQLKEKPYTGKSLEKVEILHSIMTEQCKGFDIDGVSAFVEIDADFEMVPETKMEPTGFYSRFDSRRKKWYQTGSREVTTGGTFGHVRFGFTIKKSRYIVQECDLLFENEDGRRGVFTDQFILSEILKPKVVHTLETLEFLTNQTLI